MIISVLVTWMIVDCNLAVSFITLLVVRYRSIQKRPIFDSLADTVFRSGKIRKF